MKIYSKGYFIGGLIGLAVLVLYAVGVWEAHIGNWVIAIAFTAKFLYTGLTESGSGRMKHLAAHYEEAAETLFGKHHALKTNLPWILAGGFFVVAAVLRFGFEIWLPVWIWVVFVLALTGTAFYSIGLHREITEYIDEHIPEEDEPEP